MDSRYDKNANTLFRLISKVINNSSISNLNLTEEEWKTVFTLARAHNILPLIFESASENSNFIASPDYQSLMFETMTAVASQARRTESFLSLYKQLLKADLHPVVMKGIICRQLYGDYCDLSPSGDEDILIRKSEYEQVQQILQGNRYRSVVIRGNARSH